MFMPLQCIVAKWLAAEWINWAAETTEYYTTVKRNKLLVCTIYSVIDDSTKNSPKLKKSGIKHYCI